MKRKDFKLTKIVLKELKNPTRELENSSEFVNEISSGDGFWYKMVYGGGIELKDFIADKQQIKKVEKALETVEALEEIWNEIAIEF